MKTVNEHRLGKLILPMALEQLLAICVGMADTFMVSTVGEAAISGVSLVDGLNLLVIQIMAAFCTGGVVIISQYSGENNQTEIKSASRHLEFLINTFSTVVTIVFLLFGRKILQALFGSIEDDVMANAYIYLMITAVSFLFWGLYSSGAAILRCHEDTKTSMKVSIVMNLLNVMMNAYFVFVLKMGVAGVAVATLFSRAVAGIYMQLTVKRKIFRGLYKDTEVNLLRGGISLPMVKKILSMGIPSGIENGMFHVGKLALASVISTLGTAAIAANSIAYQVIEFPNIAGNTIGLAMVVIVGQDIGEANKEKAFQDAGSTLKLAYIGDWLSKLVFFVLAPYIVSFFSLTPTAAASAVLVLKCFSIASLPIWPLSFTLPHALRGAGDVKYTMIISIISMWAGRVIIGYILVTVFHLGILGVWIGMFADWYIRGISFFIRYHSGKWLDKRAI